MTPSLIVLGAIIAFVLVVVSKGIRIVQQAQVVIIERLGKFHSTLQSGVNFILPMLDKPREIDWRFSMALPNGDIAVRRYKTIRIDLREAVYDFPRQSVITKDNVVTEINALIYYQVTDPVRAVYEIANLPDAIEKLTQTTLRNVIGEMDLDQTLASRDTINTKLRAILDEATNKWGVKVNRVELQDISPPRDIKDAMEKQMRAERERRATIITAEADKQSRILEAEGIKAAAINQAEGAKQARILNAEAEAEARLKVAQAEANAIATISESIGKSSFRQLHGLVFLEGVRAQRRHGARGAGSRLPAHQRGSARRAVLHSSTASFKRPLWT